MAHSYVMAHDHERAAFAAFLRRYGETAVLLIDTYDTVQGAHEAVAAMAVTGIRARGVRLDSGDLAALATEVRAVLDASGYADVQIIASGDLDEHRVAALVAGGAPIDAFGVGTRMGTSADAPYLGVVYKLVEQAGEGRAKSSPGKASYPGRKQVWRATGCDTLALDHEPVPPGARPLLATVWRDGRRVGSLARPGPGADPLRGGRRRLGWRGAAVRGVLGAGSPARCVGGRPPGVTSGLLDSCRARTTRSVRRHV